MNRMIKNRAATAAIVAGFAGLYGCSVIESKYGEERYRTLEGKHISEITRAAALAAHDGQLIIASRGMSRGIAFLDGSTEVVTSFHSLRLQPESMVLDTAGQLYVIQEDLNDGRGAGVLDVNTGVYTPFPTSPDFLHKFSVSRGNVFAWTTAWGAAGSAVRLAPVTSQSTSSGLTGTIPLSDFPTSVAVHGDRLFVSFEGKKHLQVLERTAPFGITDSIDLSPSHNNWSGINLFSLATWKDKLFVLVQLPPDTTYVAVLDAASGIQTGSIALAMKQGKSAGVRDGILYLYTKGLEATATVNPMLDGGVEAIDLEGEVSLGLVTTEVEIGGNLEDFVPFSETAGYALYQNGKSGWDYLSVRKITYSRPVTARKAP